VLRTSIHLQNFPSTFTLFPAFNQFSIQTRHIVTAWVLTVSVTKNCFNTESVTKYCDRLFIPTTISQHQSAGWIRSSLIILLQRHSKTRRRLLFSRTVTTLRSSYGTSHPSVACLCDVRVPCSQGWTFHQHFCIT